jgi:hypothetical protein
MAKIQKSNVKIFEPSGCAANLEAVMKLMMSQYLWLTMDR